MYFPASDMKTSLTIPSTSASSSTQVFLKMLLGITVLEICTSTDKYTKNGLLNQYFLGISDFFKASIYTPGFLLLF